MRRNSATIRIIQAAALVSVAAASIQDARGQSSNPFSQQSPPAQQQQAAEVEEHPLAPAIRFAESSLAATAELRDYTATLTKRELIDGALMTQVMNLKFREEPFSVYLHFGEPNAGREILYVHGFNQNQMLAHEGAGLSSLVGTVSLDPRGERAMSEARHPITDIGLKRMLEMVIEQWKAESQYGEVEVNYYPDARLGNIEAQVIETAHPRPRRQFRYQTTRVYFDVETQLPIRIENFGFPQDPNQSPPLVEEYTYLNVQPNVGLVDQDFDQRNPAYQFR
jgi:hypothetical protein